MADHDPIVQAYPANERGRDFFIGDLHGTLEALTHLLKAVGFDPAVDRVFSNGDLVDRGPDSLGCLRLLREPWFKATFCNHGQLMLHAFDGGPYGDYWFDNGGAWGYEAAVAHRVRLGGGTRFMPAYGEELLELLALVRALPYLITVGRPGGGVVHLLHAELPPGARPTDADLSSPGYVERMAKTQAGDGDAFLWSRFKFGQLSHADVAGNLEKARRLTAYRALAPIPGLGHLLSGHTIMQRPTTVAGQTNLDTGAYLSARPTPPAWAALTALELGTWTFHQATPLGYRGTVEAVEVVPADLAAG